MQIKILSATHKRYPMPEDEMYIPLQVNCYANGHFDEPEGEAVVQEDKSSEGVTVAETARVSGGEIAVETKGTSGAEVVAGATGVSSAEAVAGAAGASGAEAAAGAAGATSGRYCYDDTGENISPKNPTYCELTALYWGWKNLDCDYLGLVHYRRYLVGDKNLTGGDAGHPKVDSKTDSKMDSNEDLKVESKLARVLSGMQAQELLGSLAKKGVYVVLPVKRNYYIETLFSHYAHSHHETDLLVTTQVIYQQFPEYAAAFSEVMKRHRSHMFNMCIMRKDLLNAYCEWLFAVLAQVEERLDISDYTDFDKRVFGRLSELLLDVWLTHNKIPYYELPMVNLEGENWLKKIPRFIRRKLIPEHEK